MDTITICNAALSRLGEASIVELSDDNTAARACNLHLPLAKARVLRSHSWNFGRKRATLTRSTDSPLFGYEYAYTLPTDSVRICEVNGVSGTGDAGISWEIENGKILTDDETCEVAYISDQSSYGEWDDLAVSALICLLASLIAPMIQGGSTAKAGELMQEYDKMLAPLARRVDANENRKRGENMMDQMLTGSRMLRARRCGL